MTHVITSGRHMQILRQIVSAKGFPKYVKYNTFVTLYCPYFFSILSTGQTAAPAHTLNGSNDVFPRKEVPFEG